MTIAVIGATSQIGYFLLQRLVAQKHTVVAFSRHQHEPITGVRWRCGALPQAFPWAEPVETMVSFGPLDALAMWLENQTHPPAKQLIATSSMSVVTKQSSDVLAERTLVQRLANGEAGVRAQCERLGMRWTLFRPTLIYGAGLDKSLTPIAHRATRWRVFPLPHASGLRQPVHADDIAQAIIAALSSERVDNQVFEIGGGERLTFTEMLTRVRKSLPTTTLPLVMPAWGLKLLGCLRPQWQGPLSRLESNLLADNTALQECLNIFPRNFQPDAHMWQPGTAHSSITESGER